MAVTRRVRGLQQCDSSTDCRPTKNCCRLPSTGVAGRLSANRRRLTATLPPKKNPILLLLLLLLLWLWLWLWLWLFSNVGTDVGLDWRSLADGLEVDFPRDH